MVGRSLVGRKQARRKRQPDEHKNRIVRAGLSLVRDGGLYELTLANVARTLHVRESTLLKDAGSVDQIRDWVTIRALQDLTQHLALALDVSMGRDALAAFIGAQRLYAQAEPFMHEAALRPVTILSPEAIEAMEAHSALESTILKISGVPPEHEAALGWCLRALMRGATALEAADRFTEAHEIDQNFEQLILLYELAAAEAQRGSARARSSAPRCSGLGAATELADSGR